MASEKNYLEEIECEYKKRALIDVMFTLCAEKVIEGFRKVNNRTKQSYSANYQEDLKSKLLNIQNRAITPPKVDAFINNTSVFITNNCVNYDLAIPLLWFYAKQHTSIFKGNNTDRNINLFAKKRQIKAPNLSYKASEKHASAIEDMFAYFPSSISRLNIKYPIMDNVHYEKYLKACKKVIENDSPMPEAVKEVLDNYYCAQDYISKLMEVNPDGNLNIELIQSAFNKIEKDWEKKVSVSFKERKETISHSQYCAQYALDFLNVFSVINKAFNLSPHKKLLQLYLISCTSDILKKTFVMMNCLDMDTNDLDNSIFHLDRNAIFTNLLLSEIDIAGWNLELVMSGSKPKDISNADFIVNMNAHLNHIGNESKIQFEKFSAEQLFEKIVNTISNEKAESMWELLLTGYLPKEDLKKFSECSNYGINMTDINCFAKMQLLIESSQELFDTTYEEQVSKAKKTSEFEHKPFDKRLFQKMSDPALSMLFDVK